MPIPNTNPSVGLSDIVRQMQGGLGNIGARQQLGQIAGVPQRGPGVGSAQPQFGGGGGMAQPQTSSWSSQGQPLQSSVPHGAGGGFQSPYVGIMDRLRADRAAQGQPIDNVGAPGGQMPQFAQDIGHQLFSSMNPGMGGGGGMTTGMGTPSSGGGNLFSSLAPSMGGAQGGMKGGPSMSPNQVSASQNASMSRAPSFNNPWSGPRAQDGNYNQTGGYGGFGGQYGNINGLYGNQK